MKATSIANSNIAFVKYWGKKDSKLNIPMNPSISMTLDENLSTKTTVEFSEKYKEDSFILNNEKQFGNKLDRVSKFLDIVREKANIELKAKVVSMNNFPTGSGIASSASGFAALAAAVSKATSLKIDEKEVSALARLGSGSAARSIYSGFVEWSGEHSMQLHDENHWPELRDIVVIVSKEEKPISSREAMKITVEKSVLYKERIKNINHTLDIVRTAISEKDFSELAKHIMVDSDNMHDCIKEVGINYLNEKSEEIKQIIKSMNNTQIKAAYSFDAGPNVHIITLEKYVNDIKDKLTEFEFIISKPGKGIRWN